MASDARRLECGPRNHRVGYDGHPPIIEHPGPAHYSTDRDYRAIGGDVCGGSVDGGCLACAELLAVLRGARSEQGGHQIVVRKLAQRRSLETEHGFLP